MGYIKKTILLSNNKNDIAVLNIFKDNQNTFGSVRHANFNGENLILGICVNNIEILKQNLILSNGTYNFKFNNSFDINSDIGCVIVDKKMDKVEPKVWGNNNNIVDFKQKILNDFEEKKNAVVVKQMCKTENSFQEMQKNDVDNESDKEQVDSELLAIDNEIKEEEKVINNMDETIMAQKIFETDPDQLDKDIENAINSESGDFFDMISEQIDELFENNPREEVLEKIIPKSKWVKVVFEENQKTYVVGLIYDLGVLKYVSYGVPGTSDNNPLTNLEDYSQWLPIDENNGYWIMFQDAQTGESVKYL